MFRNTRNGAWCFHFFRSLFQFCFETTETFGLSQFSSCFIPFQFFPYIIHCFSVSKHQKWGLVFSLFPELVSILFRNVSKQLKPLDLVNFCHVSVRFNFSLYKPLFQCFETPEMGPGIFTFSRACFNFVSKRFETTETLGLSQFSSCFSPFQFFPYIIHCFSVSKHQKWGLVFSLFQSLFQFCFETFRNK